MKSPDKAASEVWVLLESCISQSLLIEACRSRIGFVVGDVVDTTRAQCWAVSMVVEGLAAKPEKNRVQSGPLGWDESAALGERTADLRDAADRDEVASPPDRLAELRNDVADERDREADRRDDQGDPSRQGRHTAADDHVQPDLRPDDASVERHIAADDRVQAGLNRDEVTRDSNGCRRRQTSKYPTSAWR
jgi:hypothetical protein